jgi:hypothetical protein
MWEPKTALLPYICLFVLGLATPELDVRPSAVVAAMFLALLLLVLL